MRAFVRACVQACVYERERARACASVCASENVFACSCRSVGGRKWEENEDTLEWEDGRRLTVSIFKRE